MAIKKLAKPSADPKPVSKKTKKKKKEDNGAGRTLGLKVRPTWVEVFKRNAKEKKPDSALSAFMKKEFPDKKNKTFDQVNRVRADYNGGKFTASKPEPKSVQYSDSGEVLFRRGSSSAKSAKSKKRSNAPGKKSSAKKTVPMKKTARATGTSKSNTKKARK